MIQSVQDEVVSVDHEITTTPRSFLAPLPQQVYCSLSEQDLRRIQLAGDLTGRVEVLVPDDLRAPRVASMARFAEIYLGVHLKALLDGWKGPGDG